MPGVGSEVRQMFNDYQQDVPLDYAPPLKSKDPLKIRDLSSSRLTFLADEPDEDKIPGTAKLVGFST